MIAAQIEARSAPKARSFDPLVPSRLRPITNMRKWGVSNFGPLRPFDSQPARSDVLGPSPGSRPIVADLGPANRQILAPSPNLNRHSADVAAASVSSPRGNAADNAAVPDGILTDLDGKPSFVADPATPDTGLPAEGQ